MENAVDRWHRFEGDFMGAYCRLMATLAVILLIVVLCIVSFTRPVSADESPFSRWNGMQFQTNLGGRLGLVDTLTGVTTLNHFHLPEADFSQLFWYTGVDWKPTDWLSVSPRVGMTAKFSADGQDMFLASLWLTLTPVDYFSVFVEGDFYLNDDQYDYYGYYALDFLTGSLFNVGFQAEEVNRLVIFGAHVGTSVGVWHIEVQYYTGLQAENYGHSVRLLNVITFE